jgi:hypothetical protein
MAWSAAITMSIVMDGQVPLERTIVLQTLTFQLRRFGHGSIQCLPELPTEVRRTGS